MENELDSTKLITHKKIGNILFETSPNMVAILDVNGKILDCNKQVEENTHYKKNELIGLVGPVDLIIDDDQKKALSAFENIKNKNIRLNVSLKIKRKDGSTFPSLWSGATLRNEHDKLEGYLVTGMDLSEIQKLENRLDTSKKEHYQEKLALVGEISSRFAHDIRNPLSIIQMTLENLKIMYEVDDKKQKQFDKVDSAIDRIVHQVEDVLDFIKDRPITFEKTKFSHIVSESLESIKIPHDVNLVLPKKDISVLCDKRQFAIVLNNLILNAIQAMDGKGLIAIGTRENDHEFILEIEDSGKGISKENMNKIFEPLFTTKMQGTGLGLASVKSIIGAHRGTISVTSPPTAFKIILPK